MPIVNGRLTCTTCGADLGDADDPYRDPDCWDCTNREAEAEAYWADAQQEDDWREMMAEAEDDERGYDTRWAPSYRG